MPRVLTIDDDRTFHHLISRTLMAQGIEVSNAATAAAGFDSIERSPPDAVLLDLLLPDMSGLDAVKLIRQRDPRMPVIFVTSAGSSDSAIEAMKLGAFDYLLKPLELDRLVLLVASAIEARRLSSVRVGIQTLLGPDESDDLFIGRCGQMQEVFKSIGRAARQDVSVLIRGESGTGKELVARTLYQHGNRANGPFLAVNCAALSETLLESELFGHEKGSFTGAHERRIGKFEQCDGGTIFLDEIGDMSMVVQSKILRLLQDQRFERVGGTQTIETNCLVISATNRDLEKMCDAGDFRLDLIYRLNGYTVSLPALRDRGDDRLLLLQHLMGRFNREFKLEVLGISPDALAQMIAYDWPGNVREMQSVVKRAMLTSTGSVLMSESLPAELQEAGERQPTPLPALNRSNSGSEIALNKNPEGPTIEAFLAERIATGSENLYAQALALLENRLLLAVLTRTRGNQSEASRILGITRGSLRNKIRLNQIELGQALVSVCHSNDDRSTSGKF